MSIQRSFFNWATSGLPYDRAPWESCSPNLLALLDWLEHEWGGYSLGCEQDRPIRQGTAISSHAYGAALDWRYTPVPAGKLNVTRHEALKILTLIIDFSAELHIDAIHDYAGDRIWRAGRTTTVADAHTTWWKTQNGAGSGMGEAWATYFHFETDHAHWADATPISGRLTKPIPTPQEDTMLRAAKLKGPLSWWVGDGQTRQHVAGGKEARLLAAAGLIDVAGERLVHDWDFVGPVDQTTLDAYVGKPA